MKSDVNNVICDLKKKKKSFFKNILNYVCLLNYLFLILKNKKLPLRNTEAVNKSHSTGFFNSFFLPLYILLKKKKKK